MKTINKTLPIILLLTIVLFICASCGGDSTPKPSSSSSYFVEADVAIENQTPFHFKSSGLGSALALKVEINNTGKLSIYGDDAEHNYVITLDYKNYNTDNPEENLAQLYQLINSNNNAENYGYIDTTSPLVTYPEDCYGNFNITNETASYIEGNFSFKGVITDPNTGNFTNKATVTNGVFKVNKTY